MLASTSSLLTQLPKTAQFTATVPASAVTRALRDLGLHRVEAQVEPGFRVSTAHLALPKGARVRDIRSMAEDLALRLEVASVRVRTGVKTGRVTLELAHDAPMSTRISLGDVLNPETGATMALPWAVGSMANGAPMMVDVAEAPHVLIGGQTGSGKSSHLHSLVMSLSLMVSPEALELVFVDPKQVDLVAFRDLPHVRRDVLTTFDQTMALVQELLAEVEFRYQELALAGKADIQAYNAWAMETPGEEPLPRMVVVIDELGMLLGGRSGQVLAEGLTQLAQTSRAAGIHLVLSTQRPSAASMPTQLRSQLTTRIACRMATATDSRMVLDATGAEKLLGAGDTLVRWGGAEPVRVQGTYVSRAWRDWLVNELCLAVPAPESNSHEEEPTAGPTLPGPAAAPSTPTSWWGRLFG